MITLRIRNHALSIAPSSKPIGPLAPSVDSLVATSQPGPDVIDTQLKFEQSQSLASN